jgi:hypothetical protein
MMVVCQTILNLQEVSTHLKLATSSFNVHVALRVSNLENKNHGFE